MSAIFQFISDWTGARGGSEEGLDAAVWDRFGCDRTVLVVDMEGFTASTGERGIVHYLRLIERMQTVATPLLDAHGGQLVRFEADNLFAVFAHPQHALEMMLELISTLAADNRPRARADQVHVSAGIDHGALLLDEADFFGDPVNMASKLGEDTARAKEVLTTKRVTEMLDAKRFAFKELAEHDFAGAAEPAFRLVLH